jgi:hypothetical protein
LPELSWPAALQRSVIPAGPGVGDPFLMSAGLLGDVYVQDLRATCA